MPWLQSHLDQPGQGLSSGDPSQSLSTSPESLVITPEGGSFSPVSTPASPLKMLAMVSISAILTYFLLKQLRPKI